MKKLIVLFLTIIFFPLTNAFSQLPPDVEALLKTLQIKEPEVQEPKKEKNQPEIYRIYLDSEILDPIEYRSIFEFLEKLRNIDKVYFKINTNGGNAFTTIAFINAIKTCKAETIAEIQTAYSAGGIIAMACKKQIVLPYATMMIHSIQLGSQGDINNIQTELNCFKKLNDDIIKNSFSNFLTKKEIDYVLKGGIIWLNENNIKNRLKK